MAESPEEKTDNCNRQRTWQVLIPEKFQCLVTRKRHKSFLAKRLEKILKKAGYNVVMTRKSDEGLYSESSTGKKSEDMRKRCAIIDSSGCSCSNKYSSEQLPRRKCKRSAGILLQKFRRWKTACRMLTRVID